MAAALLPSILAGPAAAQSGADAELTLPPVVVETTAKPAAQASKPKQTKKAQVKASSPAAATPELPADDLPLAAAVDAASASGGIAAVGQRSGSLTVPNTAEAVAEIQRTPGAVEVVPDTAYKGSTPAATVEDVLEYVPGVFVQTRWGSDTRLSIRGSALSRNYGLRGVQMFMDGIIPLNTADGFGDFGVLDPTAYRYVEVFKGANGLRYGANSLGGAINFVMPTGYDSNLFGARVDVGSFGFHKASVSSGNVAGPVDYFANVTTLEEDGFRDHSKGRGVYGNANLGYRFSKDFETRFYINANSSRQEMPGQVTKTTALTDPKAASDYESFFHHQRNIDTMFYANKSTLRLAPGTLLEFGAFGSNRHVMHPIYQWLDYTAQDYGGFARLSDESTVLGHRNRLIAGVNLLNGTIDNDQFETLPSAGKGALLSSNVDESKNFTFYVENSFYVLPDVALVAGTQLLNATRDRRDRFLSDGDQSGEDKFDVWTPKLGVLWDVDPGWQVFANVSRSAEVPSYGENSNFLAKLQEATTYEIGTRGQRDDYHWDFALYRAEIDNELQCITTGPFSPCSVTNADKTVHQGVELGFGVAVLQRLLVDTEAPDKLWLNTAYTLNDFYFDNDALWGNNELPGAPRHFLRAELMYRHPSGVFFGPNVEWVPEAYFVDNANTLKTEGHAIWGAKLGYEGETFSAYIEGRNLADQAYISSASVSGDLGGMDGNYFNPGSGRAVYAGVQVKW